MTHEPSFRGGRPDRSAQRSALRSADSARLGNSSAASPPPSRRAAHESRRDPDGLAAARRRSDRSREDHQTLLGAGDDGVEPAAPVLLGAAQTIIPDDHVLPLRALRLVPCDRPAERRLGQMPLLLPVPIVAIPIERDMVLEVALVEAQPARFAVLTRGPIRLPSSSSPSPRRTGCPRRRYRRA